MIVLPPGLTEDEEALQKKFAKLKKKKKALLALKKQQGSTSQATQGGIKRSISDQPVVDTATATEQAKMLVKTGAITAIKAENKNSGFKRSRTLEGKLKDPEKGTTLTFQPFQRSISADDDYQEARRPHRKFLYKRGFVRSSDHLRDPEKELEMERDPDRESDRSESPHSYESDYDRDKSRDHPRDKDRDRDWEREREHNFYRSDSYPDWPTPRKGNTLYVHGAEMTQAMLETAFSAFGNIIDLTMDNLCNCAFITFEKIESADEAIAQLNGSMVENVQLTVSVAREQPMLGVAVGNSLWGALAVMNSVKGSHQDKRTQVEYKEDVF